MSCLQHFRCRLTADQPNGRRSPPIGWFTVSPHGHPAVSSVPFHTLYRAAQRHLSARRERRKLSPAPAVTRCSHCKPSAAGDAGLFKNLLGIRQGIGAVTLTARDAQILATALDRFASGMKGGLREPPPVAVSDDGSVWPVHEALCCHVPIDGEERARVWACHGQQRDGSE